MDHMISSHRPVRNRRHSRRAWPPGDSHRPIKRLFTPEIKKMLKDWLVRRRDNPYPSRDEKKALAIDCGLTYTQICNWFANWRRKLKNSGREPQKKTWGNLIKNYNGNAKGNVEQFSICSRDSIWCDDEKLTQFTSATSSPSENYESNMDPCSYYQFYYNNNNNNDNEECKDFMKRQFINFQKKCETGGETQFTSNSYRNISNYSGNMTEAIVDHCYTPKKPAQMSQAQCFQISSTTDENKMDDSEVGFSKTSPAFSNTKYKNHIMEKYLRGLNETIEEKNEPKAPQLSKWLESAAKFTPEKNSYIDWNSRKRSKLEKQKGQNLILGGANVIDTTLHQKEELDAAVALTNLADNFRNRLLNLKSS